jgi:4-amino-4-deoxy-L-arabinose transferase-like glycosyltransferase
LAVVLAALAVRGLALIWLPQPPMPGDGPNYVRLASALAAGQGYVSVEGAPTAERPPLYPLLLAMVFRVLGERLGAVYAVQVVLDALSCLFIYLIGRRLFGEWPGLVAAALAVPYASLVAATRLVLSETLFIFLLLAGLWALVEALEHPRRWRLAACGALIGLAALTRGTALLLPLALAVPLAARLGWRRALPSWGWLLAGFLVVLAPWMARNWRVFHAVVPVATQTGKVLYCANLPPEGVFGRFPRDATERYADTMLSEPEASRYYVRKTLEHFRAHPGVLPRLLAQKIGFLAVPFDWELLGAGQGIWNPGYAFVLPFAFLGSWLTGRRPGPGRWLWIVPAYFFVLSLVYYGSPRMRLPIEPCLLLWAGAGLVWLFGRFADRLTRLAMAVGVYLTVNVGLVWASQPVKRLAVQMAGWAGLW